MFHQAFNTFGDRIYNSAIYNAVNFDTHFHRSYELIYCKKGAVNITIGGENVRLNNGDCALIFPYLTHSFTVDNGNEIWVGVFSSDHVKEFDKECLKKRPKSAKFSLNSQDKEYLEKTLFIKEKPQKYALKGCLYLIASEFMSQAEFEEKSLDKGDLVMKIIEYVEKNFREDLTLCSIAKELGYNHQYLSKAFKSSVKINFRTLLNQYRVDYARYLMETSSVTVAEAAFESGFQSLRNFNRVYKEILGQTPRELRRN